MKIQLPMALANKGDRQVNTVVPSDDDGYSSETSEKSSLSLRSFTLSPRKRRNPRPRSRSLREDPMTNAQASQPIEPESPRSRLKLRLRSRSFREEPVNTMVTAAKGSQSPTRKQAIMKRFQKSYMKKPKTNIILPGNEKENGFPSSVSTSSSVDLSADSTIDSQSSITLPNLLSRKAPPVPVALEVKTMKIKTQKSIDSGVEQKAKKNKTRGKEKDGRGNGTVDCPDGDSPTSEATTGSLFPPIDTEDEEEIVFSTMIAEEKQKNKIRNTMLGRRVEMSDGIYDDNEKTKIEAVESSDCGDRAANVLPDAALDRGANSCNSSLSGVKSVSKSVMNESNDGSTCHLVAIGKSHFIPPKEIVAITSYASHMTPQKTPSREHGNNLLFSESPYTNDSNSGIDAKNSINYSGVGETDDEEKRTAQELAVKLVGDLEALREENERYASKNRRLETKFQMLKAKQDEHMIHRGRLVKSCLYTMPVFVLCGGLDAFLATILLVWVLVEVDGYLDLNDEAGDPDNDDEDDCDSDGDNDVDDIDDDNFDDNSSMSL